MSSNNNMVTKKIRTEYMKKYRDPKWETFSKCYEDSVKYRVTRRVMEHTHKPLWDGWDGGSDSSGRSSPKIRDGVESSNVKCATPEFKNENPEPQESLEPLANGEPQMEAVNLENPLPLVLTESSGQNETDDGPSEMVPRRRQRHRAPRSEPCPDHDVDSDDTRPSAIRKSSRAKSQPPANSMDNTTNRENRRSFIRHDWTERSIEPTVRRTPSMRPSVSAGEMHRTDVGVQTRRQTEKRGKAMDRRRARSADLEKSQRSELSVVDDRWMTEYMRCFSARLR